ncbi:putative tRNA pseudouridine synthase Pus10 [Nibea albiflora]|uniref:tRNA pseudouridine synthase Pus10 n=1 Tax=Nibea albiflora TaxID=240163 RepID=A0ACB7FK21_NIBAL|nr:putative tRNA pseudouridine synthase Pus10 [Nibea albiflora]
MLPLKEKDKPVIQKLLSAGCCARCILRFCCVSVQAAYRKPHEDTLKELQAFISNTENTKSQDSTAAESTEGNNKSHDAAASDPSEDPPSKRAKLEPSVTEAPSEEDGAAVLKRKDEEPRVCVVCLGILQELCGTTQAVKVPTTCPDCFKPTKNKQSVFTRMAVVKALEKISDTKFLKHYPCPPAQPTSSCISQDIQCLHVSVFVAGRYNKFCRSLPQTPWVIDGERRMESSVEELIAEAILSSFRASGFNFSSSGREDVDVRTLGNGRPFAMELLNPHRSRLNKVEMKQLQETINKSSDKIRVRDLQIVTREAMGRMKEGEEEKTKSYTALIWTQKPIQSEDISFIDDIKDLTLDQKTPLRVLHRRALAVRQRVIHSMNTRYLDSHHFYLGLKTQAGTLWMWTGLRPYQSELVAVVADLTELYTKPSTRIRVS